MTMNEHMIIMRLLTRTGRPIGAGVDDMLDALGYPDVVGRPILFRRMASLHKILRPMGLTIRYNPVDDVFYVDITTTLDIVPPQEILPDRLAATLLVVITLSYQEGGWVSVKRVQSTRKKSIRGIRADLRELENLGYVEMDGKDRVRPGVRVPFEVDYDTFFKRLAGGETTD